MGQSSLSHSLRGSTRSDGALRKRGLSDNELALFDLLFKENISKADRERLKQGSGVLLASLADLLRPIKGWTQTAPTHDEVKVFRLDKLYGVLPRPPAAMSEVFIVSGGGRSLLVALSIGLAACASASRGPQPEVPRQAGELAAATSCGPPKAWTVDGQSAAAPAVVRCVIPWYPSSMRTHNEEGQIIWRVMVDSAGIADTATFRVVRSSNPLLVDAVRATLPYLRFSPDVHRPRLVVELQDTFTLNR